MIEKDKKIPLCRRSLSFVLALCMGLPLLASCNGGSIPGDGTQGEVTSSDSGTDARFAIISDGKANYSLRADFIVRTCSDIEIDRMNTFFEQLYGARLEFSDAEPYIELKYDGDMRSYSVTLDEESGNITITGGQSEALRRAIYEFIAAACSGKADKDLKVGKNVELSYDYNTDATDNSDLLSYIPTESVKLVSGNSTGTLMTPEWIESLVMVELRTDVASIGGTFSESYDLIDFYASVGVNGIWLVPVYERGPGGNGYGNTGPDRVDPAFAGTSEDGWQAVREFVDYAHSKGIYIFLDIITWGVMNGSRLTVEHPDWFEGSLWGNTAFNWKNEELRKWFIDVCVNNILVTGADGYRCDCEPFTTGYDIYGEIRSRLEAAGKHIIIISEDGSDRSRTYDLEQDGVLLYSAMTRGDFYQNQANFYVDGYLDIVDSVKNGTGIGYAGGQSDPAITGTGKYYTNCLTNHDFTARSVKGSRLKIGYSAILAPFIPLWYMGDEFNASASDGVLYFKQVDYSEAKTPEKSFFLEDVRRYIRIRRTLGDIFECWAENHRDSNICEVSAEGFGTLQHYARFAGDRAVLVIANNNESGISAGQVTIPFEECGISGGAQYTVTDLMSGKTVICGSADEVNGFRSVLPAGYIGVYLVEKTA